MLRFEEDAIDVEPLAYARCRNFIRLFTCSQSRLTKTERFEAPLGHYYTD